MCIIDRNSKPLDYATLKAKVWAAVGEVRWGGVGVTFEINALSTLSITFTIHTPRFNQNVACYANLPIV